MGMLLYVLKQAVVNFITSLILIHYANKSDDQIGYEAVSGQESIFGTDNTIFTLHSLKENRLSTKVFSRKKGF